jgi:predicted nucleotidyltransferase
VTQDTEGTRLGWHGGSEQHVVDDEDQQQLDRVVKLVREVLGPDVVGAYLFGSAVLGGLRPQSDLDVLVVSTRPTSRAEKQRLVDPLLAISGRRAGEGRRWRRVELTIVVESEIKPWRYPPSFDFQYGDWLRREFESGNVEPWPTTTNPDVAALITMVLLADRPLFGPPPATVFDPVPQEDVVRANVGDIDALLDDLEPDTTNVVLTLARIWTTVATGDIRSKDSAADWALERLDRDHRAVLVRARAIYIGEAEDRWDDLQPRLQPHVEHVVAQIRR